MYRRSYDLYAQNFINYKLFLYVHMYRNSQNLAIGGSGILTQTLSCINIRKKWFRNKSESLLQLVALKEEEHWFGI